MSCRRDRISCISSARPTLNSCNLVGRTYTPGEGGGGDQIQSGDEIPKSDAKTHSPPRSGSFWAGPGYLRSMGSSADARVCPPPGARPTCRTPRNKIGGAARGPYEHVRFRTSGSGHGKRRRTQQKHTASASHEACRPHWKLNRRQNGTTNPEISLGANSRQSVAMCCGSEAGVGRTEAGCVRCQSKFGGSAEDNFGQWDANAGRFQVTLGRSRATSGRSDG